MSRYGKAFTKKQYAELQKRLPNQRKESVREKLLCDEVKKKRNVEPAIKSNVGIKGMAVTISKAYAPDLVEWYAPPINPILAIFNITPNTKPRQTQSDKWKQRPCVMQYRAFADELRRQAKQRHYVLTDTLHIEFRLPMPKSWSKKKREEMNGKPHQATPDASNLIKAAEDALLGQDKGIWKHSSEKRWAEAGQIIIYQNPIT